jgi:hypothetical protein
MPDPDWNHLSQNFFELIKEYLTSAAIPLSGGRALEQLSAELQFLKLKLDHFPKTRSFDLDEILVALDYPEIVLLPFSHAILSSAMTYLQEEELLPGTFLLEYGVFMPQTTITVNELSHKQIDQIACRGIQAVDAPRIVMQYVFSKGTCPFCASPVRVDDFVKITLIEPVKASITKGELKSGEKACFHKRD